MRCSFTRKTGRIFLFYSISIRKIAMVIPTPHLYLNLMHRFTHHFNQYSNKQYVPLKRINAYTEKKNVKNSMQLRSCIYPIILINFQKKAIWNTWDYKHNQNHLHRNNRNHITSVIIKHKKNIWRTREALKQVRKVSTVLSRPFPNKCAAYDLRR